MLHRVLLAIAGLLVLLTLTSSTYCSISPEKVAFANSVGIVAMNFNARTAYANDVVNSWKNRRRLFVGVIRESAPDILAIQEANEEQLSDIQDALPCFEVITGGSGNQMYGSPVLLVRKDRFYVRSSKRISFSPTPCVPDSRGWGNEMPRSFTVAYLWDKLKQRRLIAVSLHLDHISNLARKKSIEQLVSWLKASADSPIIVMGDFNADAGSKLLRPLVAPSYAASRSRNPLLDAFYAYSGKNPSTYNAFGHKVTEGRIDLILTSPDWGISDANIDTTHEVSLYPSDHYSVVVKLFWDRDPSLWVERNHRPPNTETTVSRQVIP